MVVRLRVQRPKNDDSNEPPKEPWTQLRRYQNQSPTQIDNSQMEYTLMLSDFIDMHFPSLEAKANLAYRGSYLTGLPDIDLSSSPMLRSAVQAICFAHVGTSRLDGRLIMQSQISHGKALAALMQSLQRAKDQSDDRVVIPTIMLLCLYDCTIPTQSQEPSGWRAHYWGIHEYIKTRGPSCFNMRSSFERLLLLNLRGPTLCLGLARRKGVILSEPQWNALLNQNSTPVYSLMALFRRAIHIASLFERADLLIRSQALPKTPGQLMRDIMNVQAEMVSWSVNDSSFSDKTSTPYDTIDVSDSVAVDIGIEEHLVMSTNNTFAVQFRFQSHRIAEDMTVYWMFCLMLDATLMRLMHFVPVTAAYIKSRTMEEIKDSATANAQYLCRSVHYLSTSKSQGISGYLDVLVASAEGYFAERLSTSELGWCQAIRCATKLRVERLRESQPRTLCRIGDLADELSAATKFLSLPRTQ